MYTFGVVLYEIFYAKAAMIKIDKNEFEFKSLDIKTIESIDEYPCSILIVIHKPLVSIYVCKYLL